MSKNDAIQKFSTFYITNLLRGDENGKDRLEVICSDFWYDFVDNIVESYGSEVLGVNGFVLLQNEWYECHIES